MLVAAVEGQSGVSARQTSQELSDPSVLIFLSTPPSEVCSYQNSSWESPPSGGD